MLLSKGTYSRTVNPPEGHVWVADPIRHAESETQNGIGNPPSLSSLHIPRSAFPALSCFSRTARLATRSGIPAANVISADPSRRRALLIVSCLAFLPLGSASFALPSWLHLCTASPSDRHRTLVPPSTPATQKPATAREAQACSFAWSWCLETFGPSLFQSTVVLRLPSRGLLRDVRIEEAHRTGTSNPRQTTQRTSPASTSVDGGPAGPTVARRAMGWPLGVSSQVVGLRGASSHQRLESGSQV